MADQSSVISALEKALAGELAANPQYSIHETAFRSVGILGLAAATKDRGEDEHRHAQQAMQRLLDLGAMPAPTLGQTAAAPGDPLTSIALDVEAELRAEADWSAVAEAAEEAGDATTLHMALAIRAEESEHLRELRGWQRQIELTGAGNFLSTHTPGA